MPITVFQLFITYFSQLGSYICWFSAICPQKFETITEKQSQGPITHYQQSLFPSARTSLVIMALSLVSDKSAFLHDDYVAAIENCCVPTAVKHTLFTTCLAPLLLVASINKNLQLKNFILEYYSQYTRQYITNA